MTSSAERRAHWWQLTPRDVFTILFFIGLFAWAARPITDPDFWWHLRTGQYIVETRSIPRHDVFSYTATDHKWITHEWLSQVLMIGLYDLGGLTALLLATCAIITLTFAIVYLQCDARPYLAAFAVLLGALASAVTWGARPQMFNILLAALFLYLLDRYRAGHRRVLWLFPLLTVLWANLHSGYFLGFAVLGVTIVGELFANLLDHRTARTMTLTQVRDLAIALAVCIPASLINPNGFKMLWYPFETLGSGAMQQYIQEWWSPDFHRPEYWPLAALLLGGAATMGFTRRKRDVTDVLFFYGLGFASLMSARHIPLFAVAATPIVARYAAQIEVGRWRWDLTQPRPRRQPSRAMVIVNWVFVIAIVLAVGVYVTDVAIKNLDVEGNRYPLAALDYIDGNGLADQRMYNLYDWGGYLLWQGYPVYIDGRADVYLDDFINEYMLAYQGSVDWRRPLDKYDVDYVLIKSGASPLEAVMEVSDEWERVYRDDQAVIFVRIANP